MAPTLVPPDSDGPYADVIKARPLPPPSISVTLQRLPGPNTVARIARLRRLPDPDLCRARSCGLDDFVGCLLEHPFECPHALSYGFSFFCRHPQRNAIVLRTGMAEGKTVGAGAAAAESM